MIRQYSPACLKLAQRFEEYVPFTYDDAYYPPRQASVHVPVKGTLTIGYGETGARAKIGATCTEPEAMAWLTQRLEEAESVVNRDCGRIVLTQGQFDALTDFVFTAGSGHFESSTLLRDLLAGDLADVPDQLKRWHFQGGRIVQGLVNRRAAEVALWNSK